MYHESHNIMRVMRTKKIIVRTRMMMVIAGTMLMVVMVMVVMLMAVMVMVRTIVMRKCSSLCGQAGFC